MTARIKNYVLDTNILIHCPDSILKFDNNNVYITHMTMEELDGLKNAPGETGYNAREAVRIINKMKGKGKVANGVKTPGGGKFFVYTSDMLDTRKLPDGWSPNKPDNIILLMVMELKVSKKNVILVTNDATMMLKADILNIDAQEYKNDRVSSEKELYTGRIEIQVKDDVIKEYDSKNRIEFKNIGYNGEIIINQFVVLKGNTASRMGVYDGTYIRKLKFDRRKPFGVTPRNVGQYFAQEALLTEANDVPLVIMQGAAGTSKTFYSLACGLEQVVELQKYKRILICRPNTKFDDDIGYLKGTEMDKILPLIRPCLDNLEELISSKDSEQSLKELQDTVWEFFDRGWIKAEALAYIRGRSITNTFILIDEAQNTTPNQMLGIITRAGAGSKIVIVGDPEQIDNPRLDKYNNGLVYAAEHMKGSKQVMQLTFTDEECTRSPLAKEAAERLSFNR